MKLTGIDSKARRNLQRKGRMKVLRLFDDSVVPTMASGYGKADVKSVYVGRV